MNIHAATPARPIPPLHASGLTLDPSARRQGWLWPSDPDDAFETLSSRFRQDGYLYLTDRQAHMIISGGVNIYPQEAENCLAGHPAVLDVAVIGVPDEEMGEAVKAVVQPVDPGATGPALETELLEYCRAELATYKCPKSVDFVDQLPRDDNGKLYKRRLREQYWEGHESLVV